jgi:hypothetical protein
MKACGFPGTGYLYVEAGYRLDHSEMRSACRRSRAWLGVKASLCRFGASMPGGRGALKLRGMYRLMWVR